LQLAGEIAAQKAERCLSRDDAGDLRLALRF
jgi:hypothetical protein